MASAEDKREALMIGTRTDGTPIRRPLSPHLQVYDMLQMSSALSIMHRVTGVAWSFGAILMVWWLVAASLGRDEFDTVQWFLGSFIGIIALMGLTATVWYHTLAGIRHMIWDSGHGYDIPAMYRSGYAVLIGTAVLTALTWLLLLVSW